MDQQQSTDIDTQVSAVTEKLSDLLAQQLFVHPILRHEVRWAINNLQEALRSFRDSAHKHKMDHLVPKFELRVLQDCFLVEEITDTFLAKRAIRRHKGLIRHLINLSSVWGHSLLLEEMKNVRLSFITFWKKSLEELIPVGESIDEKLASETTSFNNGLLDTGDEVEQCGSSGDDQSGKAIQFTRLNDEDIWALFLKNMEWNEDRFNDLELAYCKNNVLRKCDGSSLAVTKLCDLLSTQNSHDHELLKLKDDDVSSGYDDQDHQARFSYILTLSYEDLPPRIRPCYLYMEIFPKAFEIPIRRLFRLWIAEGLVKSDMGSSDKTLEDVAEDYFKELVSRNMIEVTRRKSNGTPKTCRIPDILYNVFSAKAMDLGLFFVHKYSDYTSVTPPKFKVRRLAEYFDMKYYPSSDVHSQHLRSYISFNTRRRGTPSREVGTFLDKLTAKRRFGLLRVLDLEGVYKPRLPESLGKLFHLRYLGLRWTFLESLTNKVGRLSYLETLDVKHTNITTLSTSIWKAKNLRHLYMNEVHFDMSSQERPTASLANLQTLWGLSIGNKSLVVDWLSKLFGLRKLGLTCHSSRVQAIAEWISKLTNLQSLKLRSIDDFGQPSDLKLANMTLHHKLTDLYLLGVLPKLAAIEVFQFPPHLKILTLAGTQLGEDAIRMLGKLPQLNILRLFGRSYSSSQIVCLSNDFPELVVLKLWMLEELTEWKVEKGAMSRLRELEIRCCQNLEHVEGLLHLTTLKDLTLTNMPLEFVQNVKASMDKALSITINEWKF